MESGWRKDVAVPCASDWMNSVTRKTTGMNRPRMTARKAAKDTSRPCEGWINTMRQHSDMPSLGISTWSGGNWCTYNGATVDSHHARKGGRNLLDVADVKHHGRRRVRHGDAARARHERRRVRDERVGAGEERSKGNERGGARHSKEGIYLVFPELSVSRVLCGAGPKHVRGREHGDKNTLQMLEPILLDLVPTVALLALWTLAKAAKYIPSI